MQHDTTRCAPGQIGVRITPLPALRDNYIWCLDDGRQAWLVDPGEASPALAYLARQGLALAGILLTHHHADHVGGVADLLEALDAPVDLPVYGPACEAIASVRKPLQGGETLNLLGCSVQVLDVAAHTQGHLAYHWPALKVVFSGDALFGAGCGRLFEGTPAQLAAVMATLRALPPETQVACAHEYTQMNLPFACAVEPDNSALMARVKKVAALRAQGLPTVPLDLSEECATNPFLRWDHPEVQAAAQARESGGAAPASVLGVLRRWRDVF